MRDQTMPTKLLDAAEYRMRRGGYNAVSYRDLAADTNIKSSSVHYHFPRKEDLGVALIERYTKDFFEVLDKAANDATTPLEKLQAFNRTYRNALTHSKAVCLCGLLAAEAAGLPEAVNAKVEAFFEGNIRWVKGILPAELPEDEKTRRAIVIVSAHQGAIIVATSMRDANLFDSATTYLEAQIGVT